MFIGVVNILVRKSDLVVRKSDLIQVKGMKKCKRKTKKWIKY